MEKATYWRNKLLASLLDGDFSMKQIVQIILPMEGETDQEKERIAKSLLEKLQEGKLSE